MSALYLYLVSSLFHVHGIILPGLSMHFLRLPLSVLELIFCASPNVTSEYQSVYPIRMCHCCNSVSFNWDQPRKRDNEIGIKDRQARPSLGMPLCISNKLVWYR